jgi:hypothetical protein
MPYLLVNLDDLDFHEWCAWPTEMSRPTGAPQGVSTFFGANGMNATLGFRVKSGWAAAVLLAGPVESPQLLDRRVIQLCDPAIPESKQPYHAKMGTLQTDDAKIERLRKVIAKAAQASVSELIKDLQTDGRHVRQANLVVGSDIDPARIANDHIRAHALEGRLFRTVLQDALSACGLNCSVIVERHAYRQAGKVLSKSEKQLKQVLTQLGRALDGPWRADEKMAALAAWLALAG